MNPLVSIILPVYNVENYLGGCINSIFNQSYNNWELIIINDGSTDSSLDIINTFIHSEYSSKITFINKVNEGVSIARNVGLRKCKGEYIFFCDADDILNVNALEKLVDTMIKYKASLVKADYKAIDINENEIFINRKYYIRKRYAEKKMDSNSFYKKVFMNEFFLWLCLFRKDIIERNNILFIDHCRFKEDVDFILHYLRHSRNNIYINEQIYFYRKHNNATTVKKCDYSKDIEMLKDSLSKISNSEYVKDYIRILNSKPNKIIELKNRIYTYIKYILCRI